jgi:ATP-binding cassette subfamily B protein
VRAHCAEAAVQHQHEALLVQWLRSSRRLFRLSTLADALQAAGCVGIAAYLLVQHFRASAGVTGADLLLIYWTLKLPGVANTLINLAHQYPMQRNVLLRLMEPLTAPEDVTGAAAPVAAAPAEAAAGPLGFAIEEGHVLAAGRTILRDINLAVAPGEHVAIVGRSGAGKSSLLGILLGWHRLADGHLRVDGAEPTAEASVALRRQIAWVDPAIQIWNKPFLANLTYSARDPDFARTAAAIEAADLRGVLRKLPKGLQTELGEGGALLSGGEGQRVRLARALAQSDVRLALFDEPFRGVDRGKRSELLARTRREWQGTTLLCVTHDVGETLSFDRVLVMEDGRILEDGAPRDLAERPTRYRELLDAERAVRERMWEGAHWRRLQLQRGRVEAGAP